MLKLRNAFLRGWFAARAERHPPETDTLAEKTFQDRGYEAGVASGGRALPMLPNPESDAVVMSRVDMDAVLEEYHARKGAQLAPADMPADPLEDLLPRAPEQAMAPVPEPVEDAPSVKPRKSRWDDDDDAVPSTPKEHTQASPGRARRYGH